jgi:integrase
VAEVATLFLEKKIEPNRAPSTYREYKRILLGKTGDVHPAWGKRKVEDITPEDAQNLLDSIVERGAGILANRTRAVLSSMFNWARGPGRGYVQQSPLWGIERPVEKETKRERTLTPSEIRHLWKALQAESPKVRGALWLILLTGQRPSEVLTLEAGDLSQDRKWWTIPASKRKGDRAHRIFLSPQASRILADLKAPKEGWVFSSPQAKSGHYTINSLDQAVSRRIRVRMAGSDHWTPHDLRRTCATLMGEKLQIRRDRRDRLVLGHSDPTPGSHYDWADYQEEIEEIFTRWGAWVEATVVRED